MNFETRTLFGSKNHSLLVTRYSLLLLLFVASTPLASSWQLPFWNKAETQAQQQQKKWLQAQQTWNRQSDPRAMERRMRQEHQKWEREQQKREKAALKFLKPAK